MNKTVAILTPTYNRAYILTQLYESLVRQTCDDFVWYVIDDGSEDDTQKLCEGFSTEKFDIKYIKKENGGKHTAINAGVEVIEEPLTCIVDSDDYLTDDAIETIVNDWNKYKNDNNISGLCYYKMYKDFKVVGNDYGTEDDFVDTYINVRLNKKVAGDKAEVYRTDILKEHKFPVFEGEKFVTESVVWLSISKKGYTLAFINKGIYICEYRDDGITGQGKRIIVKNPLGSVEHAKSYLSDEIKQIFQWKYILLYVAASKLAGKSIKTTFSECPKKIKCVVAYPLGLMLYKYLDIKWRKTI